MTTELQNKVWSILSKEFKEEVKKMYKSYCESYRVISSSLEKLDLKSSIETLEYVFGIHNLTSDAEGEEMLTVSRKRIQRLLESCKKYDERMAYWDLINLFGSKCLPDESNLSESLTGSEPKPSEPKFKKWDKVLVKADTAISKDMEIYKKLPSEIKRIDGETALIGMLPNVMICDMQVRLGNLEPYAEPILQPFSQVKETATSTIPVTESDKLSKLKYDLLKLEEASKQVRAELDKTNKK